MRKLKLSGGEKEFAGLKELREFRGEVAATINTLAEAFGQRKTKRDAGEDSPLWEGDEEARFNEANSDREILDGAIADEERALQIAAAAAAARSATKQRRPVGGDGAAESRIVIPARARQFAGNLQAFRGDDAMRDAYTAGQWVLGMLCGNEHSRRWCNDHLPEENRTMSSTSYAAGGALVPDGFSSAMISLVEQYGVAAGECEIVPMATDTLQWPRRTGGVTFYAIGESTAPTESTPSWDGIGLVARKWGCLCKYPSELNEAAVISIADFLARETAWAWAKLLDQCVFLGDGTSTYHGIVGIKNALAAGSIYTALTGNTAFSTMDLVDFESMIGKLATWAESRAKWYISKAGWAASMMRLADAAGGNTSENVAGGASVRTFLGYPVRQVQVMNSTLTAQTSTAGLCYLGDLRGGVVIGMRRDVRMKTLMELYAETDQIGFIATVRHDVNVHDVGATSTAGGIIGLTAPGS